MRMVRLLVSLVFCALAIIYINRPTDAPSFHNRASHVGQDASTTSAGPLDRMMAATIAFRQSLIGLGPEDADTPSHRFPQITVGGPDVLKAATMTDPAAAAAEMAGVEQRILNSPMAQMIGGLTAKQARAQTGARFVKVPD